MYVLQSEMEYECEIALESTCARNCDLCDLAFLYCQESEYMAKGGVYAGFFCCGWILCFCLLVFSFCGMFKMWVSCVEYEELRRI